MAYKFNSIIVNKVCVMKTTSKILLTIGLSFVTSLAFAADHEVKMLNKGTAGFMVFEPAVLSVEVGDTVTFVATDMSHNSESIEGMIPEGATAWSGGMNKNIAVTFDKSGVYAYQCAPHAMMAMVGVINVGQGKANLAAIKTAAISKKASFVANKDRLDNYLNEL
jgi:pseudoazurin